MPDPTAPIDVGHPDFLSGHPDYEARVIAGVMSPMTARNLNPNAFAALASINAGSSRTRGVGQAIIDMNHARDFASRRCGVVAEAEIGKALLRLAEQGGDVAGLAKAMRGILALAEGVMSGKPTALALQTAESLLAPSSTVSPLGGEQDNELLVMAYATRILVADAGQVLS